MKKGLKIFLCMLMGVSLAGCGNSTEKEEVTLTIAAAASLENCYTDELIPMFEKEHANVKIEGTYDSSGKLQTQIEEGLEADVFMSAATKQMNALVDEQLIDASTVVYLLENKLVLITQKDSQTSVSGFEDITKASTIALGDPASVPAGQYAQEALTNLNIYDEVEKKASLGTNVTEVLSWVESGSAEVGIVYATDAASSDQVQIIAEAPEGSLKIPVIYPVAMVANSKHSEEAKAFIEFLQSEEALSVFEKYGFTVNK